MLACRSPRLPVGYVHGTLAPPVRDTPLHPAGLGSILRPTFAPANWSFSSALITNNVLLGVIPSAARRSKNVLNAVSYAFALFTKHWSPGPSALPVELAPAVPHAPTVPAFRSCRSEM